MKKPKIATKEEILEFTTDILRSDFDAEKIKKMELMIKCFPLFGFAENGSDTDFVRIVDDIPKNPK